MSSEHEIPHYYSICQFEQDDGFGNLIAPPREVETTVRLFIWEGVWEAVYA